MTSFYKYHPVTTEAISAPVPVTNSFLDIRFKVPSEGYSVVSRW